MNHLKSMILGFMMVSCLTSFSYAGWFSKKGDCKKCERSQKESCEKRSDCGDMKECRMKSGEAVVSTKALKILLDSKTELILLDARSGKYDDGKRIPGAKSLNAESASEEIAKVIPSRESLVITYCGSLKCPASSRLREHLAGLGYKHVIEYPQGIKGWVEAGHRVEGK